MRERLGISGLFVNESRRIFGRLKGPRVLVCSVPKSGTNLLVHTLNLFPQLTYDGTTARLTENEKNLVICNIRKGGVISTHQSKSPELQKIISRNNIKVLFIIRDPRDVSVSLFHWIKKTDYHYFQETFNWFQSDHDRLLKIITGFEPDQRNRSQKGISSIDWHFRRRLSWMVEPGIMTIKFEDLVGEFGGGDSIRQVNTIKGIAQHLAIYLSDEVIIDISSQMASTKSATFRKGRIGGWREEFSEDHKTAFKNVAGQLLIDLGYEKNFDW